MKLIHNYQELLDLITSMRNMRSGFITNFYLDTIKHSLWICKKLLYYEQVENVIFLIRKNSDFWNLFYCSPGLEALHKALSLFQEQYRKEKLIVDVVGTNDQCISISKIFIQEQFQNYCSLVRMSRLTPQEIPNIMNNPVRPANLDEAEDVYYLLKKYFDPKSEQIPLLDEIFSLTNEKKILIYSSENAIKGFLIYELTKSTLYLRYWFVHPEFRNRGIGSALMQHFFYEGKFTKRQLFWVIRSNSNAIKRYKHYNFIEENLFNETLIRRDDERENYKNISRTSSGV